MSCSGRSCCVDGHTFSKRLSAQRSCVRIIAIHDRLKVDPGSSPASSTETIVVPYKSRAAVGTSGMVIGGWLDRTFSASMMLQIEVTASAIRPALLKTT